MSSATQGKNIGVKKVMSHDTGVKPSASDVCVNTLSQQCRPALEELLVYDCPTPI